MGIIMERRQRERRRRRFRAASRGVLAALLFAGTAAWFAQQMDASAGERLRRCFARVSGAVQAFSGERAAQKEIILAEQVICALQLGIFDDGEKAAAQAQRLQDAGVRCMIWQGERMRIIVDAALSEDALSAEAAAGRESYVIRETLPQIVLRIEADMREIDAAEQMLTLPDRVFAELGQGKKTTREIVSQVRSASQSAKDAHPENLLYTQLAQSLLNWCSLMEAEDLSGEAARSYARATMSTLCRELRRALIS